MAVKTVRFSPGVAAQSLFSSQPYVMTLKAVDRQGEPRIRLPYNPESYTIETGPHWQPHGAAGAQEDGMSWSGNAPRVFSYSHLVVAPADAGTRQEAIVVEALLADIDDWSRRVTVATQQPTRVRVTAGHAFSFQGVITRLRYERVRTNTEGYCTQAQIELEITESS